LILPGAVNISGSIASYFSDIPLMTTLILNDLQSGSNVSLSKGMPNLQLVDMPSLVSVTMLSFTAYRPLNISLPSLQNASYIDLFGNFSR
jgi:hypothetical protein